MHLSQIPQHLKRITSLAGVPVELPPIFTEQRLALAGRIDERIEVVTTDKTQAPPVDDTITVHIDTELLELSETFALPTPCG